MDQQVLARLDQIEVAAEKILDEADGRKKELLKANEERIAEFDRKTDVTANEKIMSLRQKLQKQHEAEAEKLKQNTERTLQRLQTEYRDKKEALAEEIVHAILQ